MNVKKVTILALIILTVNSYMIFAEDKVRDIQTRYGMSFSAGETYNPTNNIEFYLASGFILYDYDKIWKHKAPEQLRFKVEGSLGVAHDKKTRLVTSVNIFALYYLDKLKSQTFRPYIEGGIGIIYTDFQIRGQGLRVNFNPQIGLGAEIKTNSDNTFFLAVRLHHISNGNLDDENVGIDSVMGVFGFYF